MNPGIAVLEIGGRVAVERQHFVPVEHHVVHPALEQVVENNRSYSHGLRNLIPLFLGEFGTVFFQKLFYTLHRLLHKGFEEYHPALAGGHFAFFQGYQAEVNMDTPGVVTKHFQGFKTLFEMELLLTAHHIDNQPGFKLPDSVKQPGQVPGGIQGGSVLLLD